MRDWCDALEQQFSDYKTTAESYFNDDWYSQDFLSEERALGRDIKDQAKVTCLNQQGEVITKTDLISVNWLPRLIHCVRIPEEWIEDNRVGPIGKGIRELGIGLAAEVNHAIVSVLVEAGIEKPASEYASLDTAIYETEDEMSDDGFNPDIILVNRQLRSILLRHDIVTYDGADSGAHYIGRTKTWLRVYWADEVPPDSIVMLDSAQSGVLLRHEHEYGSRFHAADQSWGCQLMAKIRINPIVDKHQGIIRLSDITDLVRQLKMLYALKPMGKCLFSEQPCKRVINASNQCFVAVPSEGFEKVVNVIEEVLTEKDITPWIAMEHERPNKNILCTKICGPIVESRYCIAVMDVDKRKRYQAPNPNVCWEYGVMTTLRKKVIPVARQDSESELPFDVKLLDFTLYKDEKSLRRKLAKAIQALIAEPEPG